MRAISSGACPVDKRLGLTLGLAIVAAGSRARARDTARRARAEEAGRRAGESRPRVAGPMRSPWAKLRNAYAASTPISSASASSSDVERLAGLSARRRRGALVPLEMLGLGNDLRARRGEERVERLELRAVEHSGRLGDALDLVEEPVAFDAIGGVLQRVLGEHDHEACATPGCLRRRMRPIRWIIWRRVRLALMTIPRFASGTSTPSSSTRGAATASSLRTRRSSRISRR